MLKFINPMFVWIYGISTPEKCVQDISIQLFPFFFGAAVDLFD